MTKLILAAALAACAPSAFAESNDCLFDGSCAPRPAPTHWDGAQKGAEEGATLGFFAGLYPAVEMVDAGFSRKMTRGDGNGLYYGGMALAVLLYLPALVLGGIGGLFGSAAGAAAPESASKWDAEKLLFD